jgi:serine/threonine protein kinase
MVGGLTIPWRLRRLAAAEMIGHTLSHYLITSELGRGGMRVVYRARDQLLNRDVAVKLMREDVVNQSDRRARVLAEGRAASALNHPGITTIYDVVESGEHLFIVMELIEGQTLRARLSSAGPVEARELARLGAQIAEALDAAAFTRHSSRRH